MELLHVLTKELADIFTKPLGLNELRNFLGMLGVHRLDMLNFREGLKGMKRGEMVKTNCIEPTNKMPEKPNRIPILILVRLKKLRTDGHVQIGRRSGDL